MELVFLEATQPLTKTFIKHADNTIVKSSYPTAYEFTSHKEKCSSLKDFERLLKKHAALGHCLLKGSIGRDLVKESRAGSTDTNGTTEWICLDIDSLPGCKDVEQFLKSVGLQDVSYIVQYSASSLISNKDLNAHLFMLLDSVEAAPLLKQWLIGLNHNTPMLTNAMQLTKTDTSIRWPLDISVCQNDKLIYIAPPILKGITDPYNAKKPRIQLIERTKPKASINKDIANVSVNQAKTDKRINELREAKGLPKRKFNLKVEDGIQYLAKSEEVATYETKTDRGFVYFNLNGGDSWGYYHPEGNPKYIRNFKSEPVYLTKELIPDYWAKAQAEEKKAQLEQAALPIEIRTEGDTYLAFCDRRTSTYWRGTYNAQTNKLDLNLARSSEIIKSFMRLHGMAGEGPIDIPEWDMIFDPTDTVRVDPINRVINTFEPTQYMLAPEKKVSKPPALIHRVVNHALGGDPAITKHFINHLAFIVQYRTRTKTAWVFHGVEGTGKGTLFHCILKPLFGATQTTMKRMSELTKGFNGFLENKFIAFIDEVQTKSLLNESSIMADLRNYITEPTISVEQKYQIAREITNHVNLYFASNKPDPVAIPKNDRRFNVGKYQTQKLLLNDDDLAQIESELQDFYHYLEGYKIDMLAVTTPIESEDRDNMISISESSVDTIGSALLEGNMGFFIDQMPTTEQYKTNAMEFNKVSQYEAVLKNMMSRTERATGACSISRDELYTLFDYTAGSMPSSPNKFTSLLKHHRIHISKVWVAPKTVNGIKVMWKDVKQFDEYEKALAPVQPEQPQKLKRVK